MKSLEHLIRDIREGKCECEKKKDSLEHAIRKVARKQYESSYGAKDSKPVEEDVGGLIGSGTGGEPKLHAEDGKKKKTDEAVGIIGTDKYQGSEFKSVRTATPHIKPPAGEGSHSQAPENASRQRIIAKEKAGINRVEEEQIQEFTKEPQVLTRAIPKAAAPIAKAGVKAVAGRAASVALGPEAMAGELLAPYVAGRYKEQHKGGMIPHPETPGVDAATSFERMKGFKVAPPKPAETRPKPETKPAEVAPKTEPKPEEKPKVAPAPATEPATTPATDTKTKAIVLPKIDVPAETKPETATTPKTAPSETTPKSGSAETKTAEPETKKGLPAIGAGIKHDAAYDVLHKVPVKTQSHIARRHRMHEDTKERETIENMPRKGDRKSIEYVGRKDSDAKTTKEKTSRLATIKNVIDEAKKNLEAKQIKAEDGKTRAYDYGEDLLIINPDQRRINLDVDNNEKVAKDYDNK